MSVDLFRGQKVRVTAFEADKETEFLTVGSRDSEFMRLQGGEPAAIWSVRQQQGFFERHQPGSWLFLIRTLADDRPIGMIDLEPVDWAAGNAWIGIGIHDRKDWGQGYGTEAMGLVLRYAFSEMNLHRVSLDVFEYNPRAIKSYQKLGFKEEGRRRKWLNRGGQRWDLIYMGILRSEWEAYQQST